jgi:hypothetical protein
MENWREYLKMVIRGCAYRNESLKYGDVQYLLKNRGLDICKERVYEVAELMGLRFV